MRLAKMPLHRSRIIMENKGMDQSPGVILLDSVSVFFEASNFDIRDTGLTILEERKEDLLIPGSQQG